MAKSSFKAITHVSKLVINGGGDADFAGNFEAVPLQPQINAAVWNLLFNHGEKAKTFCGLLDSFLRGLMLCATNSFIGRSRWNCRLRYWRLRNLQNGYDGLKGGLRFSR